MPARTRSLQVTDRYRQRLLALRAAGGRLAGNDWRELVDIDDLDGTHPRFVEQLTIGLAALQATSVRLTSAYLLAYLSSELRRPEHPPILDETSYVGVSRTGKTLAEALVPTVITVKQAIGDGVAPNDAATRGLEQARRFAITETMTAARGALSDSIASDDRIVGWRRATDGGCGACLAAATGTYGDDEPLQVHDGCQCTSEPIVRGALDRVQRPDGHELFERMTIEQQDTLLGPAKAELIRSGQASMRDLIAVSPMAVLPDQITEAPLKDVQAQAADASSRATPSTPGG